MRRGRREHGMDRRRLVEPGVRGPPDLGRQRRRARRGPFSHEHTGRLRGSERAADIAGRRVLPGPARRCGHGHLRAGKLRVRRSRSGGPEAASDRASGRDHAGSVRRAGAQCGAGVRCPEPAGLRHVAAGCRRDHLRCRPVPGRRLHRSGAARASARATAALPARPRGGLLGARDHCRGRRRVDIRRQRFHPALLLAPGL